jgi:hypothetical protein
MKRLHGLRLFVDKRPLLRHEHIPARRAGLFIDEPSLAIARKGKGSQRLGIFPIPLIILLPALSVDSFPRTRCAKGFAALPAWPGEKIILRHCSSFPMGYYSL